MTRALPSLTSFDCFACGPDHPKGLQLQFVEAGPDRVAADFTISADHTGIGDVAHGGILATVLDEAMAWALYRHRYSPWVTARMELRYRGIARANAPLRVEAWIEEQRSPTRASLKAHITDGDGTLICEGSALYVPAPHGVLDELPTEQQKELSAVFAEFRQRDSG